MRSFLTYWSFRLTAALRWYAAACTRYDVHSPHLSAFVREVYADDRRYHAFDLVRSLRRYWSKRREQISLQSLGAASRTTHRSQRTAASLVRTNAIGARSGHLLFRLALWLRPERIVEFGTNAGISTVYLHAADTRTPLYTIEGNAQVAALATETLRKAGATAAIRPSVSTFADWLARHGDLPTARLLAFIDGDHRYQPTLDYVDCLLRQATEESVIVVADIHWSAGMERAWRELVQHERVTASVDTYHFGILFLRPELNGPHLSLIPTRFKPWRVGFF
ncbi:hypothetical protein LEM8419_02631 [Neolewinella maritima]|uniref:Class I SAM-dependent methyltransferase n=1 Tax=Neolewinella maritima TaxID=1383882 RepID=A0ABN8F8Z9_9BACT|nr:class I SAM-dependent methyltransferase [Neolewinella maritima]CAH1001725.1 hypothetical protein LEM8419_02631 [Neolewinella maritima]